MEFAPEGLRPPRPPAWTQDASLISSSIHCGVMLKRCFVLLLAVGVLGACRPVAGTLPAPTGVVERQTAASPTESTASTSTVTDGPSATGNPRASLTPTASATPIPATATATPNSPAVDDVCSDSPQADIGDGPLVFVADWDGDADIYSIDPDGSNLLRLTDNQVYDMSPVWSPDGSRVAFLSGPVSGPFGLYSVDIRNGQLSMLTTESVSVGRTNISPEGVVERWNPTDLPRYVRWFAWAPDGQSIAFLGTDGEFTEVYVVRLDGSPLVNLTHQSTLGESALSWSPDGSYVVSDAALDSIGIQRRIHLMRADGSSISWINAEVYSDRSPQWHPSENRILFISIAGPGLSSEQLFWVDADGSDREQLTFSGTLKISALWSPDGQRIAFGATKFEPGPPPQVSYRGLFVADWGHLREQPVVESISLDVANYAWAPDSRHLAFIHEEVGSWNLHIADICNREALLVVEDILPEAVSWKPNGQ